MVLCTCLLHVPWAHDVSLYKLRGGWLKKARWHFYDSGKPDTFAATHENLGLLHIYDEMVGATFQGLHPTQSRKDRLTCSTCLRPLKFSLHVKGFVSGLFQHMSLLGRWLNWKQSTALLKSKSAYAHRRIQLLCVNQNSCKAKRTTLIDLLKTLHTDSISQSNMLLDIYPTIKEIMSLWVNWVMQCLCMLCKCFIQLSHQSRFITVNEMC